ncbi:F-box protein [Abeliophyllum distichum]|uniref:F-box protein n=1 Tax=Abeliophyllum distichum TaxID=126358 RepID=A0ABD1U070_9LAMI
MEFQREIKKRKCHKEEEEEDQPLNRLRCLPHEISLDILSRLPIKYVIQLRFHPVTKEYKVIKIVYYRSAYNLEKPSHFQRLTLEKKSSPGVLVNGRLHWMSQWGRYILSFDLADDSFQEIPIPDQTLRSWMNCHLSVLGGYLSAALPSRGGNRALDIWVMKEYGVQESWVKEFNLGAYSQGFIPPELQKPYRIWKNFLGRRLVRIICLLKTGDILVEYRGGTLVSYNPVSGMFKNLSFQGMPRLFQTTVHVGSLYPVVHS